jgi:hypothetical protein
VTLISEQGNKKKKANKRFLKPQIIVRPMLLFVESFQDDVAIEEKSVMVFEEKLLLFVEVYFQFNVPGSLDSHCILLPSEYASSLI